MFDIRVPLVGLMLGTAMVAIVVFWLLISIHRDTARLRGVDQSRAFDAKGTAIVLTLSLMLFAGFLVMLIRILG